MNKCFGLGCERGGGGTRHARTAVEGGELREGTIWERMRQAELVSGRNKSLSDFLTAGMRSLDEKLCSFRLGAKVREHTNT